MCSESNVEHLVADRDTPVGRGVLDGLEAIEFAVPLAVDDDRAIEQADTVDGEPGRL